jgi:hypothetical protein
MQPPCVLWFRYVEGVGEAVRVASSKEVALINRVQWEDLAEKVGSEMRSREGNSPVKCLATPLVVSVGMVLDSHRMTVLYDAKR